MCLKNGPTDTVSGSTTPLIAVSRVLALMVLSNVSANPAPLRRVRTPSYRSAVGPARVQFSLLLRLETRLNTWIDWSHTMSAHVCLTGCLHEGQERANGEMWDDSSDPCAACVCREGSVRCDRKHCPTSNCKHPVQWQCCMSCEGEIRTQQQQTTVPGDDLLTIHFLLRGVIGI